MRSVKTLLLLSVVMLASGDKLPSGSSVAREGSGILYGVPGSSGVATTGNAFTDIANDLQLPSENIFDDFESSRARHEDISLQSPECTVKYSTVTTTSTHTNTVRQTSRVDVFTTVTNYFPKTKRVYSTLLITKTIEDKVSKHHKFGNYETVTISSTSTQFIPPSVLVAHHTTTTTFVEYFDFTSTVVNTVILQTTDYVTTTHASSSVKTVSVPFTETLFETVAVPVKTYTYTDTLYVTDTSTAKAPVTFSTSVLTVTVTYPSDVLLPASTSTVSVSHTVTKTSFYPRTVTSTEKTVSFITETQSVTFIKTDYTTTVWHTTKTVPFVTSVKKTRMTTSTVKEHVQRTSISYVDLYVPITTTVTTIEDAVLTKTMDFPGATLTRTVTITVDVTKTVDFTAEPRIVSHTSTVQAPCLQ